MALYDLDNRTRAFHEVRRLNVGTAKKPRWITNKHLGDDYAETYGNDPSYAIQDGTVIFSGWSSTYGHHVRYRLKKNRRIVIGHHSLEWASSLKEGDPVYAGKTLVGHGGESASGADGNHVHIQAEDTDGIRPHGTPVDPRPYIVGGASAGDNSTPFEEDDMFTDADRDALMKAMNKATNAWAGIWTGGKITIDGQVQTFNYGLLPIVVHNQTLIAQLKGQVAALSAAVSQISGGTPINLTAVEAAAEKGAREALDGLTFKAQA